MNCFLFIKMLPPSYFYVPSMYICSAMPEKWWTFGGYSYPQITVAPSKEPPSQTDPAPLSTPNFHLYETTATPLKRPTEYPYMSHYTNKFSEPVYLTHTSTGSLPSLIKYSWLHDATYFYPTYGPTIVEPTDHMFTPSRIITGDTK